jgi:predicted nucleotidyltransferase
MDKTTVVNAVQEYANIVIQEFSPSAIVLYGSHVNGNPHEESDIDVAVIFDGFSGDWLQVSARLWQLTRKVSTYIEPILLDSTDDASGFVKNIYKTGQIIYKA